ncbi:hypothetical protein ACLMJK_004308 [Lecanora helva]
MSFLLLFPLLTALILTLYSTYLFVTRISLSPLRHIPGPKLAIFSFWYEFYYDVVLHGRYTWKIAELHDKYGPIVRINPYEVHVNDPDFYDELYVSGARRKSEQWSWTVPMFGTPNSILATIDHDVHRRRRNAYANFFSKQSIRRYSSVVQSCVDKLCARFAEHEVQGKKINLSHAWSAFTGNVVTEYTNFPLWFVEKYLPDMAVTYRWHKTWEQQIRQIKTGKDDVEKPRDRPSIFETLLDSDLPAYDKSVSRLVEDAQTIVGAGSITTADTLSLTTYYVLEDKQVLKELVEELDRAIPNLDEPLELVELEKLPCLSAVILEGLRISYGVSHRLQRVCPDQTINYHDYEIPPGTPISMTSVLIHDNPAIFPEPRVFKPKRWMPLEKEGARLQKYLVAFCRGSRQCLGMHLGMAELYLGLAGIFRRFGHRMRIVDTVKERDVELIHDVFTPTAKPESKGISMVIDVN